MSLSKSGMVATGWQKALWACAIAAGSLGIARADAATFTCSTGAQFESALTSCAQGDTIILTAGNTFTPTSGSAFWLPYKSATASYITIQSSALSSLPAGRRVSATDASFMPKIYTPNGGAANSAFKTVTGGALGPHHYKLLGLEIIGSADDATQTSLIRLGDPTSAQDTMAEVPHNLIIDRCIIRANSSTHRLRRGIELNSAYTDITNCRIVDIKDLTTSGDSQGIGGWNGPGPYNIINNYITAASENVLFGGGTPFIPNMIPSDIVIKRNHMTKPYPEWEPTSWNVKNLLELKAGQRVTIDGNIFENSWGQLQDGTGLTFKTIRSSGQGAAWTDTRDVTVTNNIIRHTGCGLNIGGSTVNGTPVNVTVRNNLFDDMWTEPPYCRGDMVGLSNSPTNVVFDHNTGMVDDRIMDVANGNMAGFVWTNNMNHRATYSFKGAGTADESTFDTFMPATPGPAIVFQKNVVKGASLGSFDPNYTGGWSPTSLAFPTTWTGVLVNQASPGTNYAGYAVVDGSAYDNAGTDGTDIGCNIADIKEATRNCVSGAWSSVGYEGFNYAVSGSLNGKTGGIHFDTNAWTAVSGTTSPAFASGSLQYTDGAGTKLLTGGNKLQPALNSQSTRNFPSVVTTAGTTKWIGFRANHTGTGTLPTNHAGFALFSGVDGTGINIFMGKPGFSATNWGIGHTDANVQKSGAVTTADRNAFLVYKLVFTGSQVTISMWVNPLLDEASLGTPHATLTKAHTTDVASMKISTGSNASNFQFDEFRMGGTFFDIAPKQ